MIHCELLGDLATSILQRSGYEKDLLFKTNSSRQSCDIKTWLTILARKQNFSFGEIAEYLDMSEEGVFDYRKRHQKRLEDTDYKLKWERIKEIEL